MSDEARKYVWLQRIVWYMRRYHGLRISQTSVYRILIRNGLRKLPNNAGSNPKSSMWLSNMTRS